MIDFDLIPKIIALILAVAGIIGLLISVPTLFETSPNVGVFIGSIIALAGAGILIKMFSD